MLEFFFVMKDDIIYEEAEGYTTDQDVVCFCFLFPRSPLYVLWSFASLKL